MRRWTTRALLAVVLLACVACPRGDERAQPPATPSGTPPPGTIRLGYPAEPPTLDPAAPGGGAPATRDVLRPVLPALFRLDDRLRPVPELVAAWPEPSDVTFDPFSVRLRLRDATWSDGTPITSSDVRFSWERLRDGPTALRYRFLSDVEVVSPTELVLRFDRPVRRWWTSFSVDDMVLPAHAYAAEWAGGPTVSGGPFLFDGWTPGLSVRLKRNDRYWGDVADAEAIEVVFVPDDETRLQLLERGELDAAYASGEAGWGHRAQVRGYEVVEGALTADGASGGWGPSWWELDADLDRLGRRAAIARAIAAAVDRDLVWEILEDSGQVMDGIPYRFGTSGPTEEGRPGIGGPWSDVGGDLDAARRILQEAGLPGRRGSEDAEVLLAYAEGSSAAGSIARLVHFAVRELGVRVELVAIPADRLWAEWIPEGRSDLYLLLRRAGDAPDEAIYRSDASGAASAPGVDASLDLAAAAVARDRLREAPVVGLARGAWEDVQRSLVATGAVTPVARVRTWIVASGVSGPHAVGTAAGPLWNAAGWRLVPPAP